MTDYCQVSFNDIDIEKQEILVAFLSEAGYESFEQTDRILKAFIPVKDFDQIYLNQLNIEQGTDHTIECIKAKNWNQNWESNFLPVVILDFAAIRADFHEPIKNVAHEIIITPKMSFGTGHHATTCLMIESMSKMDFKNKNVLDFGTGTGVLAILAEKLGAKKITAIDNDDWSIENAEENCRKNQCSKIDLIRSDSPETDQKYGIILANINRNVILENFSILKKELEPGGILLLSGLLENDEKTIIEAGEGLRFRNISARNGWISICFAC